MEDMQLRRATRDEISLAQRWQIAAAWDVEVERVKNWLHKRANQNLGKPGATVESALADGGNLPDEVRVTYSAQGAQKDVEMLANAADGRIEREAPARGMVIATDLLKWFALLVETAIFVWMVAMGWATAVVIGVGVMLAFFGWLMGDGAGRILMTHEKIGRWIHPRGLIEFAIGTVGVAAISWIRTVGEEEGAMAVVVITGLLALLIATFQAINMVLTEKYRELHQKMFSCQIWFSTDEHIKAVQTGFWKNFYDAEVRALSNEWREKQQGLSRIPIAATPITPAAEATILPTMDTQTKDLGRANDESAN